MWLWICCLAHGWDCVVEPCFSCLYVCGLMASIAHVVRYVTTEVSAETRAIDCLWILYKMGVCIASRFVRISIPKYSDQATQYHNMSLQGQALRRILKSLEKLLGSS